MSKSWDMLEICAARTTAAGVAEVLVLWRPTWEPEDEVSNGAVWDAWVSECAREKSRQKAVAASRADATADDGNGDDVDEDGSVDWSDEDDKPLKTKTKRTPDGATSVEEGRHVLVVTKRTVASLTTVETGCDAAKIVAKVSETVTPKRGKGRPPKIVAEGASTNQNKK